MRIVTKGRNAVGRSGSLITIFSIMPRASSTEGVTTPAHESDGCASSKSFQRGGVEQEPCRGARLFIRLTEPTCKITPLPPYLQWLRHPSRDSSGGTEPIKSLPPPGGKICGAGRKSPIAFLGSGKFVLSCLEPGQEEGILSERGRPRAIGKIRTSS